MRKILFLETILRKYCLLLIGLLSIQDQAQINCHWDNTRKPSAISIYDKEGQIKTTQTKSYREQDYAFYKSYSLSLKNFEHFFHVIDIYDECIIGNPIKGNYGFYGAMCVVERKRIPWNFGSPAGGKPFSRSFYSNMNLSKDKAAALYYLIERYPNPDAMGRNIKSLQEAVRYLTREISGDSQGQLNNLALEAESYVSSHREYLENASLLVFYKGGYYEYQDFVRWQKADIKLGGKVFNDLNNDGTQDSNETGISNVEVYLYPDYDGDGVKDTKNPIQTRKTNSRGEYEFLANDISYIIEMKMPSGYIPGYIGNSSAPTDYANDDDGVIVNGRYLSTRTFRAGIRTGADNTPIKKENKKISFGITGGDSSSLMTISKTASPSGRLLNPGEEITYTITLHNGGLSTLDNVVLKDALPSSTTYVANSAKKTYFKDNRSFSIKRGKSKPINVVKNFFSFDREAQVAFSVGESDGIPAGAQIESITMTFSGETKENVWLFQYGKQRDIEMSLKTPSGSKTGIDSSDDPNGDRNQFGTAGGGTWNVSKTRTNVSGDALGTYTMTWRDIDDHTMLRPDQLVYSGNIVINWVKDTSTSNRIEVTESANTPPNLISASEGISLQPKETITVTFKVKIDDNISSKKIINKAVAGANGVNDVEDTAVSDVYFPVKAYNNTTAVADINQTVMNIPVKGNVSTNDYDLQGDSQIVIEFNGQSIPSGGLNNVTVSGKDEQGNPISNAGTISIKQDGTYLFIPADGFKGTAIMNYTIKDNNATPSKSTAGLSIKVVGPNSNGLYPPIAQDDNVTMLSERPITIDILANDSDIDGVIIKNSISFDITSLSNAQGFDTDSDGDIDRVLVQGEGVWTLDSNGNVTFTPDPSFKDSPTPIVYTIKDDSGLKSSATINIFTQSADAAEQKVMSANDDANSGYAGATITGSPSNNHGLLVNDIDMNDPEDSDNSNRVKSAQAPINTDGTYGNLPFDTPTAIYGLAPNSTNTYIKAGTLTLSADGSYTYESEPDFVGTVYIPYLAQNNSTTSAETDMATLYLTTFPKCATLSLKVFLEGAYDSTTGKMRTDLNDNHLLPGQDKKLSSSLSVRLKAEYTPFGQPYQVAPWNYTSVLADNYGDVSSPSAPNNVRSYPVDVVDWILVTLRKGGIEPVNNDWQCVGLLHADGQVTFPQECDCLNVDYNEDYYLLVEHRNHLPILSAVSITKDNVMNSLSYDFTVQDSYRPVAYRFGQKEIKPGVWGMFAGNGEQNISKPAISSLDNIQWKKEQNQLNYLSGDYNMNGVANSLDEVLWLSNQNKTTSVKFK